MERDIKKIEKVQERAARIPISMKKLGGYEDRLDVWGLTKLSDRRIRGDLIQMYKVFNNLEEISFIRDPKQNLSNNRYEKRDNVGNSLSLRREGFSARDSNWILTVMIIVTS